VLERFAYDPATLRTQIRDVLAFTKDRYGEAKAREYLNLIRDALLRIVREPQRGTRRADIREGILTRHIRQSGRRARHVFLYEIKDGRPVIYAFLYDAMDLRAHLRDENP
jgi:plasmid stabilization system protein ParE